MDNLLFPRSSKSKTPLHMANSAEIIDNEYRRNIMAVVDHIKSNPRGVGGFGSTDIS